MLLLLAHPAPPTADQIIGPLMWVFFAAFLVALAATPILRAVATRTGVVDRPDPRKIHPSPVPYLGGPAMLLGWGAGVAVSMFLRAVPDGPLPLPVQFPLSILFGAVVITAIGLIDDMHRISPRVKIGGQLLAAAALASERVGDQMLGARLVYETMTQVNFLLPEPGLALPSTVAYVLGTVAIGVFVVGGCNAMNLLDGLDGLAAGTTAICALGFLFIATQAVQTAVEGPAAAGPNHAFAAVRLVMVLALLGAVIGFLPYNFNPATIFMGDAGSLLLGYLCICTILLFTHMTGNAAKFVAAGLMVFAVPITDTTLAIIRRSLRGQPLLSPDRQHLHHMLLHAWGRLRLSPNTTVKAAVLTMYLLSALFAALGCGMIYPRWRYALAVFFLVFAFILITAYKVGTRQAQVPADLAARDNGATTGPPTPPGRG